jgi:hypothetical protein
MLRPSKWCLAPGHAQERLSNDITYQFCITIHTNRHREEDSFGGLLRGLTLAFAAVDSCKIQEPLGAP